MEVVNAIGNANAVKLLDSTIPTWDKVEKPWDFPVALHPVLRKNREGKIVPIERSRTVVRLDKDMDLATVSNIYKIVRHDQMIEAARPYVEKFGNPDVKHHLNANGRVMTAEYTFVNKTLDRPELGSPVALKLFLENSYNKSSAAKGRVGALVLECLNGMCSFESMHNFSYKHIGDNIKIEFPSPDSILDEFDRNGEFWASLTKVKASVGFTENLLNQLSVIKNLIPSGELLTVTDALTKSNNAWVAYNALTYHVTHRQNKIGEATRLQRLLRIDRLFREEALYA